MATRQEYIPGSGTPIPKPGEWTSGIRWEQHQEEEAKNGSLFPNINPPQTIPTTSSSGGGGGSSSAAAAAQAAYYAQQRALQEQLRADRLGNLDNSYNSMLENLRNSYKSLQDMRGENYNTASGTLNSSADEAQRQNYIAGQLAQRNIDQYMAALGRSGGASETTLLRLASEYGNARGATERERSSSLADLLTQFNTGKAEDSQWYNTLQNQYASQYATNRDNILSDSAAALADFDAQAMQASYNNQLSSARQALATQNLSGQLEGTNKQLTEMSVEKREKYIKSLMEYGYTDEQIEDIMKKYGYF